MFSPDEPGPLSATRRRPAAHHDHFLVTADFDAYRDRTARGRRAVARSGGMVAVEPSCNTARMGWFSSDRTIREYAEEIWDVPGDDLKRRVGSPARNIGAQRRAGAERLPNDRRHRRRPPRRPVRRAGPACRRRRRLVVRAFVPGAETVDAPTPTADAARPPRPPPSGRLLRRHDARPSGHSRYRAAAHSNAGGSWTLRRSLSLRPGARRRSTTTCSSRARTCGCTTARRAPR